MKLGKLKMHIKMNRTSCSQIQLILHYTFLNLACLFHLWCFPVSRSETKAFQKSVQLFFPKGLMFVSLLCHFCSFISVFFQFYFIHSLHPWKWEGKKNVLRGENSLVSGKCKFSVVLLDMFWNPVSDQGSIAFSIHPSVAESRWLQQGKTETSICDKIFRLSLTFWTVIQSLRDFISIYLVAFLDFF